MTLLEVVVGIVLLIISVSSSASAWWGASHMVLHAQYQWAADVAADNAAEDYVAGLSPTMNLTSVGGQCTVTLTEVSPPGDRYIHVTSVSGSGYQSLWLFE